MEFKSIIIGIIIGILLLGGLSLFTSQFWQTNNEFDTFNISSNSAEIENISKSSEDFLEVHILNIGDENISLEEYNLYVNNSRAEGCFSEEEISPGDRHTCTTDQEFPGPVEQIPVEISLNNKIIDRYICSPRRLASNSC